jgi:hypothetical protein
MKRFFFAVAVVALSACVSLAEDKPGTGTTTPPTGTPAVIATTGPVMVESQPTRRGLFSRLRNRNRTTYSTTPMMVTPAPTPMPTPAPQPMPGVKPVGGTTTTPGTVVQASGNLPPGTYTTTDGTIIQIGGTQQQMQSQSERRGLFSRLRNRY